mmetsp:Transcript_29273/g.45487  ORF Transcript_29273/g.45487 Transcript_29273/m.45487 type:complete len:372 (-) Transcript_29273:41-1156(-)
MLQGEFTLASVTRISLAENGVTVPGNHFFSVEGLPCKFGNSIRVDLLSFGVKLGLEVLNPLQHLLVGQSVQWSSQSVQTSRVTQIRISKGASHQMRRVSRGVTSLVIRVDAHVQTHELVEARVVISQHTSKVAAKIEAGVLDHGLTRAVDAVVDRRGDFWKDGNDVQNIFQCVLMVVGFGDSLGIGRGEFAAGLGGAETDCELGHWVHVSGECVEDGFDVSGELLSTGVQISSKGINLLLSRDLTGQKQPKQRLQKRLAISGGALKSGQNLLTFRNGQTTEANSLIGVQIRSLPHHTFDGSSSSDALIDGNFTDDMRTVFFFQFQKGLLFSRDLCLKCFRQCSDASPSLLRSPCGERFCGGGKHYWMCLLG